MQGFFPHLAGGEYLIRGEDPVELEVLPPRPELERESIGHARLARHPVHGGARRGVADAGRLSHLRRKREKL